MSYEDPNNGVPSGGDPQNETVDEILAGILNQDGSFNPEFGELLQKYLGEDASHVSSLRGIDLSDRADEPRYRQRVEYEDPSVRNPYDAAYARSMDRRIEEKMPEDVRYMYSEAAASAQRPEFTSNGGVRYPAMGVGASEERVVYDAEWEERAKQEAARLRRVREDRMLRGDSTYVRSFVTNGRPMRGAGRSPYIDPLSADEDFDDPYRNDRIRQEGRQSFFLEGPPAAKERNRAARQRNAEGPGGRTEYRKGYGGARRVDEDGFESFSEEEPEALPPRPEWLQPEEASPDGRRRRSAQRRGQKTQMTSTLREDYDRMSILREGEGGRPLRQAQTQPETLTQPPRLRKPHAEKAEESAKPEKPEKKQPVDPEELSQAEKKTQGLRSTVAEIVDKYDKRTEEEQAKREAHRQAREAFLNNLPPEIAAALKEENSVSALRESYDDFSGAHPSGDASQGDSLRAFAASHQEKEPEDAGGEETPSGEETPQDEPPREREPQDESPSDDAPQGKRPQDYSIYLDQI